MMKRIWLMVIVFTALLSLSACEKKDTEEIVLDLDAISDTLTASGYFPSSLEPLDAELVAGQLSLYEDRIDANPEDLVDARFSMAMGVLADQFILIKGADSEATDRLEQALNTYAEDQKSSFEFYNPEQAARLDDPIIEHQGNYLLFAIGTNQNELTDLCALLMKGEKVEFNVTAQKEENELSKSDTTPAENQFKADTESPAQNQKTELPTTDVRQVESGNSSNTTTGESTSAAFPAGSSAKKQGIEPSETIVQQPESERKPHNTAEQPTSISSEDIEAARLAAVDYYAGTVFEVDTLTEINLLNGWEGEIMFKVTCSKGGVPQVDRTIALGRQDGIWAVTCEGY